MEGRTVGKVAQLYRYPVKGLSPQPLDRVELTAGRGLPHDRVLALARADGEYAPGLGRGVGKRNFHVLVSDERLAAISTTWDPDAQCFTAAVRGHEVLRADLTTTAGRAAVQEFYARVLDLPADRAPVVAREDGRRFTDTSPRSERAMHWVSVLNLASVRAFAERLGRPVDPLRFRANVHVDGLAPWAERDLVGAEFALDGVRVRGTIPTVRCAATEVDPATGRRDLAVPRELVRHTGTDVMGIYVEVLSGGTVATGGAVRA